LTVFFALLGSAHVKAAHKMLVKLTTDGSIGAIQKIIGVWRGWRITVVKCQTVKQGGGASKNYM